MIGKRWTNKIDQVLLYVSQSRKCLIVCVCLAFGASSGLISCKWAKRLAVRSGLAAHAAGASQACANIPNGATIFNPVTVNDETGP